MLARMMAVDFDTMAARSRAIAALLDDGSSAHVSCPLGTDLTLDLTGRGGISDDGDLSSSGAFGNLPCGEAFIAPASGEGRVVRLEPGAARADERTREADGRRTAGSSTPSMGSAPNSSSCCGCTESTATNLAELGIGTNDARG